MLSSNEISREYVVCIFLFYHYYVKITQKYYSLTILSNKLYTILFRQIAVVFNLSIYN